MFWKAWLIAAVGVVCCTPHAHATPLIPNDPYYATYEWYGPVLNMPKAWSYSRGSSSVIAAVLDTGVIATTPDLAGRLLPPLSATGSPTPSDGTTYHHGTWVASTLAMQVNNGLGGAGVGNFSILPITVGTGSDGSSTATWMAKGIRMAADAGAKVINLSYDSPDYGLLDSAAAYARSKGALTFMPLGNTDARVSLNGYNNLIFVSGTGRDDQRWVKGNGVGSSYGPSVALAAPAQDVLVADPGLPSGYGLISGTSFSAPLTAGAAALAWSINPNLTASEVESILYRTADDLGAPGRDEIYGYGRIDIGAVAAAAQATLPEPGAVLVVVACAGWLAVRRPRR